MHRPTQWFLFASTKFTQGECCIKSGLMKCVWWSNRLKCIHKHQTGKFWLFHQRHNFQISRRTGSWASGVYQHVYFVTKSISHKKLCYLFVACWSDCNNEYAYKPQEYMTERCLVTFSSMWNFFWEDGRLRRELDVDSLGIFLGCLDIIHVHLICSYGKSINSESRMRFIRPIPRLHHV